MFLGPGRFGLLNHAAVFGGYGLDLSGGALPPAITFTRASTGSYFDSAGVLQTAVIDAPRFDYNPATLAYRGLLIEPAATNVILRSQEFNNAAWTGANATANANQTIAPDGTTTAEKLVPNTSTITHDVRQSFTSTATTWKLSFFVKPAGYSRIAVAEAAVTGSYAAFLLSGAGSILGGSGGSIVAVGNGWYRVSLTYNGSAATHSMRLFVMDDGYTGGAYGSYSYAGDGTSGVYVWGAQAETGAVATSQIPTAGATATRAVDSAAVTIPPGVGHLTYTFDDDSTQVVAVSPGAYTIPTNLTRPWIKRIAGSA